MNTNQLVKNRDELKVLTASIRAVMTPSRLSQMLESIVTDPAAFNAFNQIKRAIGRQADQSLKTRAADSVAASLLGFNNPHEMFAHYDAQIVLQLMQWSFGHRQGDDVINVITPKNMNITTADLMAIVKIDHDIEREDEDIRHQHTLEINLPIENVQQTHSQAHVFDTDDVGIIVPFYFSFNDKLPNLFTQDVTSIIEEVMDGNLATDGSNFSNSGLCILEEAQQGSAFRLSAETDLQDTESLLSGFFNALSEALEEDAGTRVMPARWNTHGVDKQQGLLWGHDDTGRLMMALFDTTTGDLQAFTGLSQHKTDARVAHLFL
jgi:hypothetical protein